MIRITWTHPGIATILDAVPVGTRSLLDAGCGRGLIGALSRIYRSCDRLVGVDAFEPALETCRRHGFYDEVYRHDLRRLPLDFPDSSFDVVTCIEVIEHLPRRDGLALIAELERLGRRVIITTPNGMLEQGELEGNALQRHRSGWTVADFRQRGYRVEGVGGLKVLGKHRRYVSSAFGPLTRKLPRLSELLLCVRHESAEPAEIS